MQWSSVFSIISILISLSFGYLTYTFKKDTYKSKELQDKFDELSERIDDLEERFDDFYADYTKLEVLEERINNEISASSKYRDKIDDKLDLLLKETYAKK